MLHTKPGIAYISSRQVLLFTLLMRFFCLDSEFSFESGNCARIADVSFEFTKDTGHGLVVGFSVQRS